MLLRIGLAMVCLLCSFYHAKSATITSTAQGGLWNSGTTWTGGVKPASNDDVIISAGSLVTLDASSTSGGIRNLTIQTGGSLVLGGANTTVLYVKGDIINNGTFNLWINESQGASLNILGASTWYGTGTWNLAQLNISDSSVEFAADMTITINRKIDVTPGIGSLNMTGRRAGITFVFAGTENGTIPSQGDRVVYGNINMRKVLKDAVIAFTVTGTAAAYNTITVLGDITVNSPLNIRTTLDIGSFNILELNGNLPAGNGRLKGGTQSDMLISGAVAAAHLNLAAGSLRNLTINRPAGVVLDSSITVLQTLALNNACRLILPSINVSTGTNGSLSIGTTSTLGSVTGNGYLVQAPWALVKELSDVLIRGTATSVDLRFSQTGTENIIHDLTINKSAGVVNLLNEGGSLYVRNTFTFTQGTLSIGNGTLKLTGTVSGTGFFRGSPLSVLNIGNDVASTGFTLYFDQQDASTQTLKTYRQLRNATVTLGNALSISESVDLSGGLATNRLASNGNITLLSTQNLSANVLNLGASSITGDVKVQRYISGGNLAYRGYRLITSPVTMASGAFNLAYLKNSTLLSGAAGGGFDKDGNPSLYLYREDIKPSVASFVAGNFKGVAKLNNADLNDIGTQKRTTITNVADTNLRLSPGNGLLYFFRGDRINNVANKTQAPFAIPEAVTLTATGTLNQGNIQVKPWYKTDAFLGYTNNSLENAGVRGYNLVANPYPSAIDWNSNSAVGGSGILLSNANDIDPKIFYLNNTAPGQNYIWYDSSTGLSSDPAASRYISSGQGFFIRAKSASATLTFTEAAKTTQQAPVLLMGQPQKNTAIPGFFIRLWQDSLLYDYCSVYFDNNWSENYSEDDAPDTDGASPELFLSTFSADGKRLALNKSRLSGTETSIALYVDGTHSGDFKLGLRQIRALPADEYEIVLRDLYKSASVRMTAEYAYSFSIDKTDSRSFGAKRFVLIIKKVSQNKLITMAAKRARTSSGFSVFPNPATQTIRLNRVLGTATADVSVIDLSGKTVLRFLRGPATAEYDVHTLLPGIYYLRISMPGTAAERVPFIKL